jgi:plasmid stabilization system protein ParE
MVKIIWSEPAFGDLDTIADYIALDNPRAARHLVRKILERIDYLADFPDSGSKPRELRGLPYRQIVEPPCRVFYRHDGGRVFILHVMRGEMRLNNSRLAARDRELRKK